MDMHQESKNAMAIDLSNQIDTEITNHNQSAKLSEGEKLVLNHIKDAWNSYQKLENKSSGESEDFMHAIHRAQYLIALRVARRADPDVWM